MRRYIILSGVAAIVAILMIIASSNSADRDSTILVLCAPSLAGPMEELKQTFNLTQRRTRKLRVENTYRGSAELLAMYKISQIGDVLIAADDDYHDDFIAAHYCDATVPVAEQFPCLIFNTLSAREAFSVLSNEETDMSMSVPKPKHAAIGRRVVSIVGVAEYQRLLNRAKVSRETVSQVAADVSSGIVDVGIAWNTSAKQFDNLKSAVPPGWLEQSSQIGVSVLLNSPRKEAAETFVEFLRSTESHDIFRKHGFSSSKQTPEVVQGGAQ